MLENIFVLHFVCINYVFLSTLFIQLHFAPCTL